MGLKKEVTSHFVGYVAETAEVIHQAWRRENAHSWEFIQGDETFCGKRKYNKGHRVRKETFWFQTIVQVQFFTCHFSVFIHVFL